MSKKYKHYPNPQDCDYFNVCSANLCPLDRDISERIWFADEEICKKKEFKTRHFIINQKKLKKTGAKYERGFFTFNMLNRRLIISKGTKGINPDSFTDLKVLEKKWIKKHPTLKKREPSEKLKIAGKKALEKYREKITVKIKN